MQLYDCTIRLGGSVLNEVPKTGVTAPEIMVLRALHGGDAVVKITKAGSDKRRHQDERQRLYTTYANPEINNAETVAQKMTMLRNLFGHDTIDLPTKLPDEAPAKPEDDSPEDMTE